jgi:hypothetical protein
MSALTGELLTETEKYRGARTHAHTRARVLVAVLHEQAEVRLLLETTGTGSEDLRRTIGGK